MRQQLLNFQLPLPASEDEIILLAVVCIEGKWAVAKTQAARQLFEHVEIDTAGGLLLGDLREAIKQLRKVQP